MKSTILFDLDGTLLYTIKDIQSCLNTVIVKYGYSAVSEETTLKCIGYGARELIIRSTGEKNADKVDAMLKEYSVLQENCDNSKTEIYKGVGELLKKLKKEGYKLGIVSNKPNNVTQVVVKEKLGEYGFDYYTGCLETLKTKPDPALVNLCLKNLNAKTSEAIYVGDSEVDVKTFKNAGVDGIGVLWGYRSKETLQKEGCTRFASNASELYEIIKTL